MYYIHIFICVNMLNMARYCCSLTNKCVKELVGFINVFKIYPNMFRQVVAIFRGS
jgi:hypothetical protein